MTIINKIFYDILLKINIKGQQFEINENLIVKYFDEFDDNNRIKYKLFDQYFLKLDLNHLSEQLLLNKI